jgi:aspartate racemase
MQAGITTLFPGRDSIDFINHVIYNELCRGVLEDKSKQGILRIIDRLKQDGAQGIILGCTELSLIIKQEDVSLPVFDTLRIHAEAAVALALD